MKDAQPHRIYWLARLLTIIGLVTVVTLLGAVGWTLARIRVERAQRAEEKKKLDRTALEVREKTLLGEREIQRLLADTDAVTTNQSAVAENPVGLGQESLLGLADLVTGPELPRLRSDVVQMAALKVQAQTWRTNYQAIAGDLRTQHSLGQVRETLAALRGAADSLEGRRRLDEAMKFRRWRAAAGGEATQLAGEILLDQSRHQNRDIADFCSQLAECARLVEVLAAEEHYDELASLKDNQFKPTLNNIDRVLTSLEERESAFSVDARVLAERLQTGLFGAGAQLDEVHQTITAGHGGLFALQQEALRLRQARNQLQQALAENTRQLETDVLGLTQAIETHTAELAQEMEQGLVNGWRKLIYYGVGCSAVFLWVAWRISREIHSQVRALERARAQAEAAHEETQKLMEVQRAANAELAAAHRELQASEIRFRSLSAAAPIGIFLTDAKGVALYFNPHWLAIAGLTLEQSLGDGWKQAVHPEDAEAMALAQKTAHRNGWGFHHEFRFRRPTGESRWVHTRTVAVRSTTGNVSGYVWTTEDITERRKSEELLRLQEAALRSAANVVVITNRKGTIVWTNPAFTKITGYSAEEVLGQNPRVLKTRAPESTYAPNYYQTLWKTISSGRVWHGEFHNLRKDGSDLIEEATITPVPNERGFITHYVAVKQDITARKHAEAELAKAQKELVDLSRQAGMAEVATGVLHNVGNVLNSVNVSSSCIAQRLRTSRLGALPKVVALFRAHESDLAGFFAHDPKARQVPGYLAQLADHLAVEQNRNLVELDQLQTHVDHIKEIVVTQQAFAKVSGVTETMPVGDLLEGALRMNAISLAKHGVQVRKEYGETPVVTVDKHKVMQILVNLLSNAKQACDESPGAEKQITLQVTPEAGQVRISVSDNGVGIAPENLDRIFNHGFTTKRNGHGFGLHSGANAAREMGGRLSVQSAGPGHGATFTLELPTTPKT